MRFHSTIFAAFVLGSAPAFAAPVDCSKGPIPAGPAKGTLNGVPFTADLVRLDPIEQRTQGPATFDVWHIYLSDKAGSKFDFTVITVKGKQPDGHTFVSDVTGNGPEAGPGSHEVQGWEMTAKGNEVGFYEVNDASLQAAFGHRTGNAMPVSLHFCVPSKKTDVAGAITVPLK
ncbi:MAG: hypothetical protein ISS15_09560 [Alphaproteobacteria bacterium]|nr:hypothetical protein [Alphaproteobacteria bacterium]MBL6938750.1 hypothetical protein [Alphaproteobacteria bacterium]MBL7097893.1 hypothetical protein [Alphaproteobacteria bacterium]